MSENVLENIIKKKIEKIDNLKKSIDLKKLDELIQKNKSYINFKDKIENNLKENKTILIILAGVSDDLANNLYQEALKLDMSVIVEVHTVEEAQKALNFKDALIGINNRNLKTLKTDINTTYDIYNVVKNHKGPLISESGIKSKEELLELNSKTSINTFLIGESLLKKLDENSIFSVL